MTMYAHSIQRPRRENGFSLIEVLVTLVVIALGLLGFAGLQTYSLQSNRISMQNSLATMQAYSIIDSIRANRVAALGSSYNQDYTATTCAAPSTSGSVAAVDLAAWNAALACNLTSGQGKITVANDGTITIWIKWKGGLTKDANGFINPPWSTQTTL